MKKTIILVLSFIALLGCSSDSDSDNQPNPADYSYFISGRINGEPFIYGQLTNDTVLDYSQPGYGNSIITNCAFNPTVGGVTYASGVYPNLDDEMRPSMYFDFVRFYLCDPNFDNNANEIFNDSFPVGSYTTAVSNDDNIGTTGAVGLTYFPDATGNVTYQSFNENQTGNTFEITTSINSNVILGSQVLRRSQLIEGTFSFTLYNTVDASDTVTVTDGQFKLFVTFD